MTSLDYDVIVVGAGIFGSCTAYHCQKLGLKTLLLEQFKLGHSNGSSHGFSRITRYAHEEVEYVPLVSDAYAQVDELEKKRNEKLWKQTGLLWVSTGGEIDKISSNLKTHNIEHEVVRGSKIHEKYPQFQFGEEWQGLIDPKGGVIYANKWLHAFQDEFVQLGGVVHEEEELISYNDQLQNKIEVKTNKGSYSSRKIIFTVGSWITKLLPELDFKIDPISISVCYWKAAEEKYSQLLNDDHFPVVIAQEMELKEFHYALPDNDHQGSIKFCYHAGDTLTADFQHPEKRSQSMIDLPAEFIKKHLPVVDHKAPSHVDFCKYTNSPDDHYLIGPIPSKNPNVLVGGCGCGSGFKVSPGIGRALAEMAADKPTTVDVSFFSVSRFQK
ncbi:unnamed protein product [Caenorhabditis angaria]|uniref:sarcosine oxidasee (formaldehyde-forming) n=1 Tax=Caenorhabditis angaria TaxID=860376 RepID=A0A9P1NCS2_9PELO|nr:unnamed protein product [Caenorhabditis angaria]